MVFRNEGIQTEKEKENEYTIKENSGRNPIFERKWKDGKTRITR
jgi:hypothetical protein